MGVEDNQISKKDRRRTIIADLSKIVFPERCPVCMDDAEDLAALSAFETKERWNETRSLVGGWIKSHDRVDAMLQQERGGITLWIPTCMQHGSDTITTPRKKVIAAFGFLILLYPFIFYLLGLAAAQEFSRPIMDFLLPLLFILGLMVCIIMYGFYPRALERSVRIAGFSRSKNKVTIILQNDEYRNMFLEQNALHADLYEKMKTDNNLEDDIGGNGNP